MTSIGNGWCQCRHCPNRAKTEHPEKVFAECRVAEVKQPGAGTHLKRLLAKLGITETAGCGCKNHAATMDRMGADWCEENLDTIVGWLREAAEKQGRLFLEWPARQLVKIAIRRARRFADLHLLR